MARYLSNGDRIVTCLSRSIEDAIKKSKSRELDIIVASIDIDEKRGIGLLDELKDKGVDIPVVFYGHDIKESTIINAVKHGAELVLPLSDEPKTNFLELRSLIEEIISRRKAEVSLKQSVEDLRAIVTRNVDATMVLDQKGYILFANPAAESLFNIPEPELIGKLFGFPIMVKEPVEMYILREFQKFVAVEMRMVEVRWRGKLSYLVSMRDVTWHVEYEEQLTRAKDRLEAEARSTSSDLMKAYQSLRSEVSERKRAEMALRESERKYRQIVELANEGIWVLDKNAIVRFVNPRMAEMLGYNPEEMIGRSIYDFVNKDFVPRQKYLLERRKQGIKESYDSELLKKDGTKLLAIANSAPLFDEEGHFRGSMAMCTDITERKQTEDELKEAKAQAELYLDLMGHDIRNLAQIAIGYVELAMESDDIDEIKTLLEKPLQSLHDTAQIIDNVRKLQNTDHVNEEIVPVDLCQILADIKSRHETTKMRHVTIDLKTIPRCQVMANSLVSDIFVNLVSNAIKHSDPEKMLNIDIKVDRFRERSGEYLRVAVEDNGPGISNWVKDKIFMRFQRGDTKTHGKGLGLHIARTLVESYGGKIWVEDRVQGDYTKGARFVVILPAA